MENKVRFLHTADLHLGAELSLIGAKAQERKTEMLLCLEKIFRLCRENTAQLLLIAGDLFENNSAACALCDHFFRCVKDNPDLTVVFAAGNHDPLTADSPFLNAKLPENLIVLGTEDECVELQHLPVRISGRSFKSVYSKGSSAFSLPVPHDEKINIMVMHADLGSDASSGYNPINRLFIETSGMDYIALGHVHSFSGVEKCGKTHYCYPGTPEPHGFDETGIKGVVVGEFSGKDLKYQFVPTSIRTYETVKIDISQAENSANAAEIILEKLKALFETTFADKLFKIILVGEIESSLTLNIAEITRRLSDSLYYVKIKNQTKIKTNLDLLKNENTLKGKFAKIMLEKIELATNDAQKKKYEKALYLGLQAFHSEVVYDEN